MQQVRVLIADDQPTVVAGMQQRLAAEPWITLLGLAPSFVTAAEWLAREPVDVVIFGLNGMGVDSFSGVRLLQRAAPQTRLVVCSARIHGAAELLEAGVLGYVSRLERLEFLVQAIRTVMRGERYCSPEVAEFLEQTTGPLRITPEERAVLELLDEGVHDSIAMAERMGVHPIAVQRSVNALRNKSHCFSREELAEWYRRLRPQLTPEGTMRRETTG